MERRGAMSRLNTATGTRFIGGSDAGAKLGFGKPSRSRWQSSWRTVATTASIAPRFAPAFRQRAERGGLIDELLAARGAGSPVSFTVWPTLEDGHSPST